MSQVKLSVCRASLEAPENLTVKMDSSRVCIHSLSCFTCPLPDCQGTGMYNEILSKELYRTLVDCASDRYIND